MSSPDPPRAIPPRKNPFRRILFATTGLRTGGGIASVSRCIMRAFAEEVDAGRIERVDLLSLGDPPDLERFCNGEQRSAQGQQARFVWHAWRLMRHRPDLVMVDHLGLGRAFQLPIPGIRPKRRAVFIHGTEFWALDGGTRDAVVREADFVLTNSHFTAATVRESMPELGDRLRPVPLCIDPELVDRWAPLEVGGATVAAREAAVLIVARMHVEEPGKGHDTLIQAWPQVRQSVPGAQLWIVGDGTARPGLEKMAEEFGAEGVKFLGKISDEELSNRYRRAGLFAMPSQQEGFGLVYAEAMWHGLPCVGSHADAAREVIRDGATGALVPYGDPEALANKVVELLLDSATLRRLSKAAEHEAATRFAYARFRNDLLAALEIRPTQVPSANA